MKRSVVLFFALAVVLLGSLIGIGSPAGAQDDDPEATISSLQTQVAEQRATAKARGARINAQKTQIAELRDEIEDLRDQIPPTQTPQPERTGKDKYPYVGDPLDVYTRPHNYIGHNMSFCGTVGFIQVAPPDDKLIPLDDFDRAYDAVLQVFLDGVDAQFMAGFNGDTTGIYEDSHVCVWGTLIDTFAGSNAFGGTIINPFFEAEYLELA